MSKPCTIINIVACENGWCVYTHEHEHPYGCGVKPPCYVFDNPHKLGNAVLHLVKDGNITGPDVLGSPLPVEPCAVPCGQPWPNKILMGDDVTEPGNNFNPA